jgi:N utilization substance protein B
MGNRRKARESALQILFQLEFNDLTPQEASGQYWKGKREPREIREYADWLVEGVLAGRTDLDEIIQESSQNWRIERMAVVDRNILRMAVFEFLNEKHIAPAIIINEAIEIAKKYGGREAATFVNGVLDSIRKKLDTKIKTEKAEANEKGS